MPWSRESVPPALLLYKCWILITVMSILPGKIILKETRFSPKAFGGTLWRCVFMPSQTFSILNQISQDSGNKHALYYVVNLLKQALEMKVSFSPVKNKAIKQQKKSEQAACVDLWDIRTLKGGRLKMTARGKQQETAASNNVKFETNSAFL